MESHELLVARVPAFISLLTITKRYSGMRCKPAHSKSSHPRTCSMAPILQACATPSAMSGCSYHGGRTSSRLGWSVVEMPCLANNQCQGGARRVERDAVIRL